MCSLEAECKDTVKFKFTNTDTKLQHQNTIYTPTEHLSIQQHIYRYTGTWDIGRIILRKYRELAVVYFHKETYFYTVLK